MSIHELGTAAQNKLPVTWVVLNDGAFGWVQWIQRRDLDGRDRRDRRSTRRSTSSAIAQGQRLRRRSGSTSPKELGPALERAKRRTPTGIPFVVDVPVDQAHHHAEFDRFHGYASADAGVEDACGACAGRKR